MGFRFRKSINLGGGFKVNLSKSGVGYSWGTKGVRFTKTASGKSRTTLSIPGTGISHVTETAGKKKTARRNTAYTGNFQTPNHRNGTDEDHNKVWMKFFICLFTGVFGVHKFVEKKIGMGILYLFTCGLFGFGWLYDCIKYLIAAIKSAKAEMPDQIVEAYEQPAAKYPFDEIPKKRRFSVKKMLLWVLTAFLALFALVFLPHISGIIFLAAAVIVAPIEKWQNLISRFVKGKTKAIAATVMAVLAFFTVPTPDVPETEPAAPVVAVIETAEVTEPATVAPTEPPAETERISFDEETYAIGVGRTVDIPFTLYPENADTDTLEVSVDHTEIAAVAFEKEGGCAVQITGLLPGEVTVTLRSGDTAAATKTVTVEEVMPEGITVIPQQQEPRVESVGTFSVAFTPADVTVRDVTWQSDAPDVIKVDEDGSFEALSVGEATVTATHESGVIGTVLIRVLPIEVERVTLTSNWEEGKPFCKGDALTLTAEVLPENAADKSLIWTSSDESVATVSEHGVVTAISPGTAVITAEAASGKTGTYQVTVDISPQSFSVSASIYMKSNDHVGNSWSTGFEFNGEQIYSGSIVSLLPGETFTVCGWAQDNDSKPDYGDYDEKLTLDNEMCQNGFTIEGEAIVYENAGRYSNHCAVWQVTIAFTPIN